MSDVALALYDAERYGFTSPRRWLARYGNLTIAHSVDTDEFKEYSNMRRQIQNCIRPIPSSEIHNWPGAVIQ